MPSAWSKRSQQTRHQTSMDSAQLLNTSVPDASLDPRLFTFTWSDAFGPVADAVRRHYDEHSSETFTVVLPRSGEIVTVQWFSPPSIQWTKPVVASLTGELEEVLAHE